MVYQLADFGSPPHYANGRVYFEVELGPQQSWHTCANFILVEGERIRRPTRNDDRRHANADGDRLQRRWLDRATALTSANEDVYRAYRQSVEDLGALRLYDHDAGEDVWLPAAGVPWFVALFGRDSLIASYQSMMVYAPFAVGSLSRLAQFQATEIDDWRDAEPGKIPHELRTGELAHFNKVPHTPYYGTADATILYLIVLHEAWKWLGDVRLLERYRGTAERCLDWIDRYGDLDGDGFQEYRRRSERGYENMGWKDAGDAVVYPDGSQVKQPKALCELQGYVYDAKCRMAEIYDALRLPDRAIDLRREAAELRRRFNDRFWLPELGLLRVRARSGQAADRHRRLERRPLPLERDRRPGQGRAGRRAVPPPGHVERLGHPDAQRGPPGLQPVLLSAAARSGRTTTGSSPRASSATASPTRPTGVARDIFEATSYFLGYRLPELYAGLPREPGSFPVQYVGANIPQAWAAGSIFQLVQTILGLRADAPHGRLYVDPTLPRWLPDVTLRGLKVGSSAVDIRFWREGDRSRWDVLALTGDIQVAERRWSSASDQAPPVDGAERESGRERRVRDVRIETAGRNGPRRLERHVHLDISIRGAGTT